jgi:hypothetical protein
MVIVESKHKAKKMSTKTKESTLTVSPNRGFGLTIGDELILPQPAYSIRNNCQLGQWMKSDGITPLGNKLEMGILNLVNYFGDLGKTRATNWIQVWGVSPQVCNEKIVFVTYVKGTSLTILGNTILDCALEEKNPSDIIFQASFQARSNEYGSYYTLNFEPKDRTKDDPMREKIQRFLGTPQVWTDVNLPATIFPSQGLDQNDLMTILQEARNAKAKD